MAPAPGNTSCRSSCALVGLFTLSIILLGLIFSALARPWLHLSWWKVFRRCVSISAALSLWLIVTRVERRTLRSYGFFDSAVGKRQFFLGVGLGVASLATLFAVGLATGNCQLDVTPDRLRLWRTIIGFIPAAVLVGVLEELTFRGFIFQHLAVCSKPLAVIASSVAYSLVHLKTRAIDLSSGLELMGLFLLGIVLALSYLRTRQLYLAVGLHASLAYGAGVNKLLFAFPNPSRAWLTGTSRLVNGLVGWMVLLAVGGLIVWWRRSSRQGGVDHGNA